jgi:hypothetical protein
VLQDSVQLLKAKTGLMIYAQCFQQCQQRDSGTWPVIPNAHSILSTPPYPCHPFVKHLEQLGNSNLQACQARSVSFEEAVSHLVACRAPQLPVCFAFTLPSRFCFAVSFRNESNSEIAKRSDPTPFWLPRFACYERHLQTS